MVTIFSTKQLKSLTPIVLRRVMLEMGDDGFTVRSSITMYCVIPLTNPSGLLGLATIAYVLVEHKG